VIAATGLEEAFTRTGEIVSRSTPRRRKPGAAGSSQHKREHIMKQHHRHLTLFISLARMTVLTVAVGGGWAVVPAVAQEGDVVAPGATVTKLAEGFSFTEGPASDAQGNVLFTDQPNDRIMKWSIDGQLTTFKHPSGRANGLYFDQAGNLWACADEKNELWCIQPDGTVEVVVKDYEGKLLNGPNDLWIRPDGGIYFTDPFYRRNYWNRGPAEQSCQGVYFVPPDHQRVVLVAGDLETPNGIIGTPDGKTLYVADIKAGKTYAYEIEPDGSLTNKRLFCELGSDGMTIDNEGNVYLTGRGVTVFNAAGEQVRHIPIEARWTANVCFGGADRKTLFITASEFLYGVPMRVHGVTHQQP
jgi:gluconolactonase